MNKWIVIISIIFATIIAIGFITLTLFLFLTLWGVDIPTILAARVFITIAITTVMWLIFATITDN